MLPVLERLLYRPVSEAVTRVLVLVPTRELGVQVYQVTRQLAQFTTVEVALSVGGLDLKTQENMLRRNPDIVIATPGRLIDHVKNTPTFGLESIEVSFNLFRYILSISSCHHLRTRLVNIFYQIYNNDYNHTYWQNHQLYL